MKDEFTSIKTIFDNAPIGMALSTVDGSIVSMNERFIKMLGYNSFSDAKKHIKHLAYDLYDKPETRQEIYHEIITRQINTPHLVKFRRKDGSLLDVRLFLQKYTHQGNHIDYMISTIEDLSYQKSLETTIAEVKRQYRQLLNSSTEAVFIHKDEHYIDCNQTAKVLFGITDTKKNFTFADLSPEYQPNGKKSFDEGVAILKKVSEGFPQKFEWEFIDAKGKALFAQVAINKIENGLNGNFLSIIRDITKQKMAEEKLTEQKTMLRTIIDCLPFELFATDLDSNVLLQNSSSKSIWGDSEGKNIYEGTASKKGKEKWKRNLELIKKNQILDYEDKLIYKKHDIYARKIVVPYNHKQKVIGAISLSIDITERKKAEIQKVESQNRANIQRAALAEIMFSHIFSFKNINDAFQKIAHLISSTLSVARGSIWAFSDDGSQLKCLFLFNQQTETYTSGDILHINEFPAYFNAIKKENRVYAEDTFNDPRTSQLKDIHLKKHCITSLLDSGIFLEGKLIGVVSAEHIGEKRKWMPDEESFISTIAAIVAQLFEAQKRKKVEHELIEHKNNLESLVEERTQEINQLNEELQANNEELYTTNEMLLEERNRLKEALEELKLIQAQLIKQEKMASIGTLTAGIAHEINNPVNFISSGITGLEFMLEEMTHLIHQFIPVSIEVENRQVKGNIDASEIQEKITELLEELPLVMESIKNGVGRTTNIVKGLRTFTRLDSQKFERANINQLIDSTLTILFNKYKGRIEIVKSYSDIEEFYCFPGKLGQAFLNLLVNAIQAIEDKGKITITTSLSNEKDNIIVKIKDSGSGIPEEILKNIFDPFFTTKNVGEGTGLGLSIVHGIIEEHGGVIEVESKKDLGTEFTIFIPFKKDAGK